MRSFDPFDPVWDPVDEGTVWLLEDVEDGVPWRAWLGWFGGGWTRVVGVEVGPGVVWAPRLEATLVDPVTRRFSTGIVELEAVPVDVVARVTAAVERERADIELSQRVAMVMRDVEAGALDGDKVPATIGGLPFRPGRDEVGRVDEVGVAAGLYRLFADMGRRSYLEDVATALHVSRATAARRIEEARERGYLPPVRPTIRRGQG